MTKKSETDKKCREILEKMISLANEKGQIAFEEDFGGNTLTILLGQGNELIHTHVGVPDCSFEVLIDQLHGTLVEGCGLSWA